MYTYQIDSLGKSLKSIFFVILAKAGIQEIQQILDAPG